MWVARGRTGVIGGAQGLCSGAPVGGARGHRSGRASAQYNLSARASRHLSISRLRRCKTQLLHCYGVKDVGAALGARACR